MPNPNLAKSMYGDPPKKKTLMQKFDDLSTKMVNLQGVRTDEQMLHDFNEKKNRGKKLEPKPQERNIVQKDAINNVRNFVSNKKK